METSAPGPSPAPPARYDLFFREGSSYRFVWRMRNEGVALTATGLEWTVDGIHRDLPLAEISRIHLRTAQVPRSGEFGVCSVFFRNGIELVVSTVNSWGTPDESRIEPYVAFVRDLHARLSEEDRGRIRFVAGNSDSRHRFGMVIAVIAGAFFVLLPLGLAIVTGESKALFLTLTGGFLVFPVVRSLRKNEPRSYDPRSLDDDLFP
ncbi:MAG: hypothetical protein KDJ88_15130 [Bauldia sp.]|nr:hypothetical protein [Bauldia sp.]